MLYNKRIFKRCFSYTRKYWFYNIKYIPLYFKLLAHLMTKGYDEYATWETFDWFIVTMRSILTEYRKYHHGYPVVIDNYPFNNYQDEESKRLREENREKWDGIIDRMIELLDCMDENSERYHTDDCSLEMYHKQAEEREAAKNEFFELFSKYFWNLWD